MDFYFNEEEIKETTKKSASKEYNCETCGLYKKCKHPKFGPFGNLNSKIVILTDSPSKIDDEKGIPLRSQYGEYIREKLAEFKIHAFRDCITLHALSCKLSEKSSAVFYKCCRPILKSRLEQIKPNLILCFGDEAVKSVFNLDQKEGIKKLRNRLIPSHEFNCLVFPLFHPSDILKGKLKEYVSNVEDEETTIVEEIYTKKDLEYTFKMDLTRIIKMYTKKYNKRKEIDSLLHSRRIFDNIQHIEVTSLNQLEDALEECRENGQMAFDYEANCLKPYDDDFKTYVTGFGYKKKAWAIYHPEFKHLEAAMALILDALISEDLIKIIHNKKYEEAVTQHIVDSYGFQKIKNIYTPLHTIIRPYKDPMVDAHIIDQRRGCTSLNFLNLVRFGYPPYDKKVKAFLKKKNKEDKLNRIHLIKKEDLLFYNNLDVVSAYYQAEITPDLMKASDKFGWCSQFLNAGHDCFSQMSYNGVPINKKTLTEMDLLLEEVQDDVLEQIRNLPEVIKFEVYLKKHLDKKKEVKKQEKEIKKQGRRIDL